MWLFRWINHDPSAGSRHQADTVTQTSLQRRESRPLSDEPSSPVVVLSCATDNNLSMVPSPAVRSSGTSEMFDQVRVLSVILHTD